jgi:hypothetical protein
LKKPNLEEATKAFFDLEVEKGMLDWRIRGIQVWPIFRFELFRTYLRETGVFEYSAGTFESTPLKRANKIKVFKYAARLIFSPRLLNLIRPVIGKTRVALIPFYRRDDEGKDHLSTHIIEQFGSRGFRIGSGPKDVYLPSQIHRKELNTLFAKIYGLPAKLWIKFFLKSSDISKYRNFVQELEARMNFKMTSREKFPVEQFRQVVAQSWGYRDLFKLENVATVFVVDAIHLSVVRGAKLAGCRFVELQHGSIYPQHPSHNWPAGAKVQLAPDEFMYWGSYWIQGIRFASNTQPVLVGAIPSMTALQQKAKESKPNQAIFISSYDVTERLFAQAVKLSEERKDLNILYKGHPREDLSKQEEFLKNNPKLKNLTIITAKATAIDLISESEYVIGVNSTALFEAAALGKKVVVLEIPGWEISKALVERGDAHFVGAKSDLGKSLAKVAACSNESFYYGAPVALDTSKYLKRPKA